MSTSTPRARTRTTSRRVRIVDRLTAAGITAGGILVIVCVLGICLFLVAVVTPLFRGAGPTGPGRVTAISGTVGDSTLLCEVDEYRLLGFHLARDGTLTLFSPRTGEILETRRAWEPAAAPTAFRRDVRRGQIALGQADGGIRIGRLAFQSGFLEAASAPAEPGQVTRIAGGLAEVLAGGTTRSITLEFSLDAATAAAEPASPVAVLDFRSESETAVLAAWLADGRLLRIDVGGERNFLTGEVARSLRSSPLPAPPGHDAERPPRFLRISSRGDELYVAGEDGVVLRYDLRDAERPAIVERVDLVAPAQATLTSLEWTLGERSLLAGDSEGALSAWSRVPVDENQPETPEAPPPADGFNLARTHGFRPGSGAVTAIAVSARDKSFAAGHTSGSVRLHHLTSEQLLAGFQIDPSAAVAGLQIAPKGDAVLAADAGGRVSLWGFANPHPETTIASLIGRIWYEGSSEPEFVWQSSSGTDDFEPKLGLVPLVFGTLKATLYSMLFALPIALGAALYTSEFLDRRLRGRVKTTIELMASLPSVVLGFLAALVLAPLIESSVLAVLTGFGLLPVVALAFGYLVETLPAAWWLRLNGRVQLVLLFALLAAAAIGSSPLAALVERTLFAGDFKAWLAGGEGGRSSGLAMLLWPPCLTGLLVLDRTLIVPRLSRGKLGRSQFVALEAAKFAALVLASLLVAGILGAAGVALGLDPRGVLLATYVQRNALVVGFVMGFAVIPIIYTISEDTLSSVPQSLRSASLGCGATRWQTAIRVVLPVALPGICSAIMIGLGRAVGETMIVLMAAGNTPVLDLNVFSGLRTLSANIAVELPEAVKDGTLYRVLFLAALTLFALTFAFNTLAEVIRQRLRKRYAQL